MCDPYDKYFKAYRMEGDLTFTIQGDREPYPTEYPAVLVNHFLPIESTVLLLTYLSGWRGLNVRGPRCTVVLDEFTAACKFKLEGG